MGVKTRRVTRGGKTIIFRRGGIISFADRNIDPCLVLKYISKSIEMIPMLMWEYSQATLVWDNYKNSRK
jgi:hypothetical protein